jgi:hypothetical protein
MSRDATNWLSATRAGSSSMVAAVPGRFGMVENPRSQSSRSGASGTSRTRSPKRRAASSFSFQPVRHDREVRGATMHGGEPRETWNNLASTSMRFPVRSGFINARPVMLPPGRTRLSTTPPPTGSALAAMTTGIVFVAFFTAKAAGVETTTTASNGICASRVALG